MSRADKNARVDATQTQVLPLYSEACRLANEEALPGAREAYAEVSGIPVKSLLAWERGSR